MAEYIPFQNSVDVTANKTLTAADSGIVQNVVTDGITITLPATANSLNFIFRNGGQKVTGGPAGSVADATCGFTVAPNAADGITGAGFTAAVNKGAVSTKATAKVGDLFAIEGSGTTGVTGWSVTGLQGVWTRVP